MLDDDEVTAEVVVIGIKVVVCVLVEEIFAQESLKMLRVVIQFRNS